MDIALNDQPAPVIVHIGGRNIAVDTYPNLIIAVCCRHTVVLLLCQIAVGAVGRVLRDGDHVTCVWIARRLPVRIVGTNIAGADALSNNTAQGVERAASNGPGGVLHTPQAPSVVIAV